MNDERPRPITELHRKLQEGEEYFLRVLEGVRDYAILMLSPEGRIMTWNAGAQAMKGTRLRKSSGSHSRAFILRPIFRPQSPSSCWKSRQDTAALPMKAGGCERTALAFEPMQCLRRSMMRRARYRAMRKSPEI